MKAICLLLLACCWTAFAAAQPTVPGFSHYPIQGFDVLVSDSALAQQAVKTNEAILYLDTLLGRVLQLGLAADILEALQEVPIFMEYALTNGSVWYHPDKDWLSQNGYNPLKAKAVEIANLSNFMAWSRQNQPWIMMHELSHAFHDQVLGFTYLPIQAAYQQAMSAGIYNSVPYNPGFGNPPFNQPAYAKINEREYFAEITEAYLGENDYFPFDSIDLKAHDLPGYELVRSVWRFSGASSLTSGINSRDHVALHPNPGEDLIEVREAKGVPVDELVFYNVTGQRIASWDLHLGGPVVEVRSLPKGVYLWEATTREGKVSRGKWIRQ